MRTSIDELLRQHGLPIDWAIPDNQHLTLHILNSLSKLIGDPDKELFPLLIQGVPTGFKHDIPPSFATVDRDEDDMHEPLSVHMSSRKSAHDAESITDELVQLELDKGWIEPFKAHWQNFRTISRKESPLGNLALRLRQQGLPD